MQDNRTPSPDGASTNAYDDEDGDSVVNPSANTPLGVLIAERLSRRETLRGLAASAAFGLLGGSPLSRAADAASAG
ncbi:MAG TPA: hypothetical protein VJ924_12895, partial [Alphaproteobacteria bacterium]|nr:hypothetical protein [Alphaproteobacteria bacterium]